MSNRVARTEAGFSTVEVLIAIAVLSIGLLGFIGVLSSAQVLSRGSKEMNGASNAIVSAVEKFRQECRDDFDGALSKYEDGLSESVNLEPIGTATLWRTTILDETAIQSPAIDIDGDGDTNDVVTDLTTVKAAVLRVRLEWKSASGVRSLEHVAVIARGDV